VLVSVRYATPLVSCCSSVVEWRAEGTLTDIAHRRDAHCTGAHLYAEGFSRRVDCNATILASAEIWPDADHGNPTVSRMECKLRQCTKSFAPTDTSEPQRKHFPRR